MLPETPGGVSRRTTGERVRPSAARVDVSAALIAVMCVREGVNPAFGIAMFNAGAGAIIGTVEQNLLAASDDPENIEYTRGLIAFLNTLQLPTPEAMPNSVSQQPISGPAVCDLDEDTIGPDVEAVMARCANVNYSGRG